MSDDLTVSGGGSTIVATDDMLAQMDALQRMLGELDGILTAAYRMDAEVSMGALRSLNAPYSSVAAEEHTQRALALLKRSRFEAELVLHGLQLAIGGYNYAERLNENLAKTLTARLGHALGALSPLLVALAIPALGTVTAGVLLSGFFTKSTPAETLRSLGVWLRANADIVSDPTTVALVRSATGSSDDFLGGLLRIPEAVTSQLGDEGLGVTGLGTAAALVALLGSKAGILKETDVAVTKTGTTAVLPPASLRERAGRIPAPGTQSGDQIRIEKFSHPGEPDRFEVYIGGTVDFGVPPEGEPFDMTSNLQGIGGLPAGSLVAVQQAMAEAGITADSPVVLNGYSQGGLVGSLLAASGDYNVRQLVTFGSPSGLVEIPPGIPVLTVRHSDDIVPATGGYDINPHALVIEREVFAGLDVPKDFAVPAHQLPEYRATAALIDDAGSAVVKDALAVLEEFSAGSSEGESSTYLATRVD